MDRDRFRELINEYESNTVALYILNEHKGIIFYPKETEDVIYRRQEKIYTMLMAACCFDCEAQE